MRIGVGGGGGKEGVNTPSSTLRWRVVDPDKDQEGKNDTQKYKKLIKFNFFEVLDFLFWKLKASSVA